MSSEQKTFLTKENLDAYLKETAKEYRKLVGKSMPAELILVDGAAVLTNYGFRDMTMDADAVIQAASSMKDAANKVGDRNGLPNGWLNADFTRTESYSPKLVEYSVYYKKFYGVLEVRTVTAEYLIAMKLRSGRQYKNDFSDVLGILAEHEKQGEPITIERIETAVKNLYGDWLSLPESSRKFIQDAMANGSFTELYAEVAAGERAARSELIEFEEKYPGAANERNINEIIASLKCKRHTPSEKER